DLLDAFAVALDRFVGRDAEAAELVRQEGAREADIEPPVADRVEHADLAGELQRVVEDGKHRAGDQPHAPCALRGGGQEQHGVGAVAAVIVEIMLDDAGMGEAESFGFLGDVERFGEIVARRFLLGLHVGKELDAEFHRCLPLRSIDSLLIVCMLSIADCPAVIASAAKQSSPAPRWIASPSARNDGSMILTLSRIAGNGPQNSLPMRRSADFLPPPRAAMARATRPQSSVCS